MAVLFALMHVPLIQYDDATAIDYMECCISEIILFGLAQELPARNGRGNNPYRPAECIIGALASFGVELDVLRAPGAFTAS